MSGSEFERALCTARLSGPRAEPEGQHEESGNPGARRKVPGSHDDAVIHRGGPDAALFHPIGIRSA
ncbi:MAG: hypothetical protein LT102_03775 [Burkholderiaceae bacterium]|nr:hypothetical protein [Burkholderiaceae bacterium]